DGHQTDAIIVTNKEKKRLDTSGNIWFRSMTATMRFKDIPHNNYRETIIRYPDTIYQNAELLITYKSDPWDKPKTTTYFKSFIGDIERTYSNERNFEGINS